MITSATMTRSWLSHPRRDLERPCRWNVTPPHHHTNNPFRLRPPGPASAADSTYSHNYAIGSCPGCRAAPRTDISRSAFLARRSRSPLPPPQPYIQPHRFRISLTVSHFKQFFINFTDIFIPWSRVYTPNVINKVCIMLMTNWCRGNRLIASVAK